MSKKGVQFPARLTIAISSELKAEIEARARAMELDPSTLVRCIVFTAFKRGLTLELPLSNQEELTA